MPLEQPLLTITDLVAPTHRSVVDIFGELYEVRSPAELNVLELQWVGALRERLSGLLFAAREASPDQASATEAQQAVAAILDVMIPNLSAEAVESLHRQPAKELELVAAFFVSPSPGQAGPLTGTPDEATGLTGVSSSPGSNGSTGRQTP